jgi:hypothetical protein
LKWCPNEASPLPSVAIILVFKTSKGFPQIEPIPPDIEPAKNF